MSDFYLQLILGTFVTVSIGTLAYFIKRYIDTVDDKLNISQRSINRVEDNLKTIKLDVSRLYLHYSKEIQGVQIRSTVDKVGIVLEDLKEIKQNLEKISPQLSRIEENYGKIILLDDKIRLEAEKLRVLYRVVDRLASPLKDRKNR